MPDLLVIDDEPSILHAFGRVFRAPGFTLQTASSAAQGIDFVRETRPDVVVLDVHLPDASGLETLGRIQAIVPDVTGLIPSSWCMPCFQVAGIQNGVFTVPIVGSAVWIEYELGATTFAISNMAKENWKPSSDGPIVAFELIDFDAAIAELKAKKIPFEHEPMETPVCWMAVIADPDGNKLTVHKRHG